CRRNPLSLRAAVLHENQQDRILLPNAVRVGCYAERKGVGQHASSAGCAKSNLITLGFTKHRRGMPGIPPYLVRRGPRSATELSAATRLLTNGRPCLSNFGK